MDLDGTALVEDTLYVGLEDGVDVLDGLYHLSEPGTNLPMLAKDFIEHIHGIRCFIGQSMASGASSRTTRWDRSCQRRGCRSPRANLAPNWEIWLIEGERHYTSDCGNPETPGPTQREANRVGRQRGQDEYCGG